MGNGGIGGFVGGAFEDVTGIDIGGTSSADRAMDAQRRSVDSANATQKYMFDQQRADNQPWLEAGKGALGGLQADEFKKDFTMSDFQQDPGYAFRMAEGQKALERSAAAKGGLNSGGTMKALARYGQDYASNEFNNAYNRFNSDRDRRFNRLSSLAGIGQTANTQIGQAGMNYGNSVAGNEIGMGNAAGANYIAQGNKMGTMFNNMIGAGATVAAAGVKASDERLKTDIAPVNKDDLAEMKAALKAYSYKYKDSKYGDGEFIGIMAQDLEKSKLGKTLVVEDENGFKMIDLGRAVSLWLATMAEG